MTEMSETYVIIGAGHAAGQVAQSLRSSACGFTGRLIMVGEEPYLPYQRPPLSKQFLAGEIGLDRVYFKPPAFYEKFNVETMLNCKAVSLDRAAKQVRLSDGQAIGYDKLVIATGSRARTIAAPGVDLPGIFYLRTVDDVEAIRASLKPGRKLVIVGGGYIGLEVAAVMVKSGLDVTVVEMAPTVLARVVDPLVAEYFASVHRKAGVKIENGVAVQGFAGKGRVERVLCADGREFPADIVIIGVGIVPNVELAQAAGLACDNGIVVDEFARTSDPAIFAAGDCANHPNRLLGRRLRLESVHNALEQGKTAALAMCGKLVEYAQVPWFWSDQYDLKLQIAGLSGGQNKVIIRGSMEKDAFAAFYLKGSVIIAVDAVNSPQEFMASKQLIANKTPVDLEKLGNPAVPMKEITA
jgi:3-phenylpropionate/trans-cinnamate dioxygenase ferredoxin reductase component